MEKYQVVYQTRGPPSEGGGVRTRTFLKDDKELEEWYTPEMASDYEIVAAGVMKESVAVALCLQTPFESILGMIVNAATNPATGEVNKETVAFDLRQLGLAKRLILEEIL